MNTTAKLLPIGGLGLVVAGAWAYLLTAGMALTMTSMSMPNGSGMSMPPDWTASYFLRVFLMWAIMMVAMMLPSALPAAYRLGRARSVLRFAAIYTAAWVAFAAAAALAQWILSANGMFSDSMALSSGVVAGGLLIAVGLYQLTPLIARDLTRCHDGNLYVTSCLRCCAPLMLVLFVFGVMNVVCWIALAFFVLVEKASAHGIVLARIGGVALIIFGIIRL